jgi:iduronate 2-sulfatase
VLNKLDQLKLRDSTLIVMVGDNGVTIGENGMFGKDTNFDLAARVPLIFNIPWMANTNAKPRIQRMGGFFELHDIFPTLTTLMNVPLSSKAPPLHGVDCAKEISLFAADRESQANSLIPARKLSFNQIYRCPYSFCTYTKVQQMNHVGYSVRSMDWRYVVWLPTHQGKAQWNLGRVAEELYWHGDDSKTLLNYASGARWDVEARNVAESNGGICDDMFQWVIKRFNTTYESDQDFDL